ncbi:hypothetical protein CMV_027322 [Castanea mollissima]|uniref:DUF1997 family protein n=1 Tax=Castanea mollissima TaxID=60419 RepID=A0A8J4VF44_9ROSI|nr:hypothetical protein CMV_027322 [Castanea mollissima]
MLQLCCSYLCCNITMMLTTKWHGRGQGCASFLSSPTPKLKTRKKTEVIKLNISTPSESNVKKANLSATRKERIKLPNYDDDACGGKTFHISEFLGHPSGIQAMLNTSSLQSFQALDTNTYRCFLPKVQLLNFEAAPVLDLRVTPTNEDCTVEMLSCKVSFSSSLRVQRSWNDKTTIFQIYTRPFTMMPVSSVERPGNLMMQALVDRLFPLHIQQLLQDYDKWVHQQLDHIPRSLSSTSTFTIL